jgi:hypothetical protein
VRRLMFRSRNWVDSQAYPHVLKRKFKRLIREWQNCLFMPVTTLRDLILVDSSPELIRRLPNPLNRFGRNIIFADG